MKTVSAIDREMAVELRDALGVLSHPARELVVRERELRVAHEDDFDVRASDLDRAVPELAERGEAALVVVVGRDRVVRRVLFAKAGGERRVGERVRRLGDAVDRDVEGPGRHRARVRHPRRARRDVGLLAHGDDALERALDALEIDRVPKRAIGDALGGLELRRDRARPTRRVAGPRTASSREASRMEARSAPSRRTRSARSRGRRGRRARRRGARGAPGGPTRAGTSGLPQETASADGDQERGALQDAIPFVDVHRN